MRYVNIILVAVLVAALSAVAWTLVADQQRAASYNVCRPAAHAATPPVRTSVSMP